MVCSWKAFATYSYKHSSLVRKLKNTGVKSFITSAPGQIGEPSCNRRLKKRLSTLFRYKRRDNSIMGQCYSTFTAVIYECSYQAGVFDPGKPFQLSLMFASMAGTYSSEAMLFNFYCRKLRMLLSSRSIWPWKAFPA
jgi:hypothetical protein